jgi:ABC-type polysaccharide/polyol phosphate export permease
MGQIMRRREMLSSLVMRELKSRYKGSALGFLWSIMTPLFMAVIYVFFLRLLARGVPIAEIVIGVFAWQFTVQSVQSGMESITGNANLVKKVAFPRVILPTATTLAALVNFLLSLAVQFVLLAVLLWRADSGFGSWLALVPLVIIYHTLFNLALAMLMGAANVYFRDTQHLVGVLLTAWFFLSPVMYPLSFLDGIAEGMPWAANLYMLNPVAIIVTAYRAAILPASTFAWTAWTVAGALWPLVVFLPAYLVFKRAQRNFADFL